MYSALVRLPRRIIFPLLLALIGPIQSSIWAANYDLSAQFGTTSNPSGVWSYGWETIVGGPLSLLTNYAVTPAQNGVPTEEWFFAGSSLPGVFHNGTTNISTSNNGAGVEPPGATWFTPGNSPQNFGAIRFTVPPGGGGLYALFTSVQSYLTGPPSRETDFHVVWNGTEVFGQFLPGDGGTNLGGTLALSPGDTIDFLVGRGEDGALSGAGLNISAVLTLTNGVATITTNPPPPLPAGVYNLSASFGAKTNPSGAWSYGCLDAVGGSFSNYDTLVLYVGQNEVPVDAWTAPLASSYIYFNPSTTNATGNGGESVYPPGSVWCQAGAPGQPGYFAAIRFTVPAGGSGYYSVGTASSPSIVGPAAGAYQFEVAVDGSEVFNQFCASNQSASYTNTLLLTAGDTVDFLVGPGNNPSASGASPFVQATITLVPPPAGVYNLSASFGADTNPSGAWSYGWLDVLGGTFSNFDTLVHSVGQNGVQVAAWTTTQASSYIYFNPSTTSATANGGDSVYPPGSVWCVAGVPGQPGYFAAIRFTVPAGGSGYYSVGTASSPSIVGPAAGAYEFEVAHDGAAVFNQYCASNQSASYTNTLLLAAGDTVDFLVGRGSNATSSGACPFVQATISLVSVTNVPPPSTNVVYNLSANFGTNSNPSGPWSYGWESTLRGSFTVDRTLVHSAGQNGVPVDAWTDIPGSSVIYFNPSTTNATGDNGQSVDPPGAVWCQAGVPGQPDYFAAIRFTVPAGGAGYYSVATTASPSIVGSFAGAYEFHVALDGSALFGQFLTSTQSASYSNTLLLATGDTVDLLVGRGSNATASGANPFVQATITLVSATNAPPPPPAGVYNLSAQFGTNSNPSGVWSYGWETTIGGALSLLTNFAVTPAQNGVPTEEWYFAGSSLPGVFHNGTTNTSTSNNEAGIEPPGATWFTPGNSPQNFGAIRFTVPPGGGGLYALSTAVQSYLSGPLSGETDFHVVWNGTQVFGQFLPGNGGTNFGGTVALSPGDTIDFLVGRGADSNLAGAGLNISAVLALTNGPATITTNPPPPPPAGVYDLSASFGAETNPSGAWSYGWLNALGGSFTNFNTLVHSAGENGVPVDAWTSDQASSYIYFNPSTTNATANGGDSVYPPGSVWCQAGAPGQAGYFAAIRFTVPAGGAGYYGVGAASSPSIVGPAAGAYEFEVAHDGTAVFNQLCASNQNAAYTNTLLLAAGDTVDFLVGRGSNATSSGACPFVQATISLVSATNAPPPPTNAVYNLSANFGTNSNPSGPWSYGWESTLGGSFTLDPTLVHSAGQNGVPVDAWTDIPGSSVIYFNPSATNATGDNGQSVDPPGAVWCQAGVPGQPDYFAAIRFTVPAGGSGYYSVATSVSPSIVGSFAGAYEFHVALDGSALFGDFLTSTQSASYSNTLLLGAGDTVDLLVGRGSNATASGANPFVQATITLVSATNVPPPPPAGVYNLSAQFGTNSNPSGVWSYGWETTIGGALSLLTNFAVTPAQNGVPTEEWYFAGSSLPGVFHNGTTSVSTSNSGAGVEPPGATWFTPGNSPQNFGAIRFTVPPGGGGLYALSTSVQSYLSGPLSGETDFHVVWNGTQVFGQFLPGNGGTNVGGTVALSPGDTIDFLVGRGEDGNLSGAGLNISAVLALTNGPATITTNLPPPPPAGVYDLSAQFGTNSNPNGGWSYGWKSTVAGSFTLDDTLFLTPAQNGASLVAWLGDSSVVYFNPSSVPAIANTGESSYPPGSVWVQAGSPGQPDYFGAIRFTVPVGGGGNYSLSAAVSPSIVGTNAGAYEFHVAQDGSELFGQFLTNTQSAAYTNVLTLAAGDTVDLLVGRGSNATALGSVAFVQASISLLSQPSTTNGQPLEITSPLPDGTIGGFYSAQLGAVGGQAPYFWTLAPGSAALPPGLSLSTNGLLSGIPAALGETTFIVQVTDANTNAAEVFTITVVNPPSLSATGRSGGGDFQFVLGGGLSQNYTVQFTTNLAPGSWTTLFVTNNPGLSSLPLAVPFGAGATGFYRVMVGP